MIFVTEQSLLLYRIRRFDAGTVVYKGFAAEVNRIFIKLVYFLLQNESIRTAECNTAVTFQSVPTVFIDKRQMAVECKEFLSPNTIFAVLEFAQRIIDEILCECMKLFGEQEPLASHKEFEHVPLKIFRRNDLDTVLFSEDAIRKRHWWRDFLYAEDDAASLLSAFLAATGAKLAAQRKKATRTRIDAVEKARSSSFCALDARRNGAVTKEEAGEKHAVSCSFPFHFDGQPVFGEALVAISTRLERSLSFAVWKRRHAGSRWYWRLWAFVKQRIFTSFAR